MALEQRTKQVREPQKWRKSVCSESIFLSFFSKIPKRCIYLILCNLRLIFRGYILRYFIGYIECVPLYSLFFISWLHASPIRCHITVIQLHLHGNEKRNEKQGLVIFELTDLCVSIHFWWICISLLISYRDILRLLLGFNLHGWWLKIM